MILRNNVLFRFLLLQCLVTRLIQAAVEVEVEVPVEAEEAEDYVRVLVGFRDLQEEKEYVRRQRMQPRSGKPKAKINYQFQQTEALAMQVTREELQEMKKDSKFSYIEEDVLVPVAGGGALVNATNMLHEGVAEAHRQLFEFTNYGINLTQAQRIISPDPDWDQECGVYACVVDSGVFLANADIPYSRGDGYVDGKSFGGAEGEDWYYPRGTNHGTHVAGIMIAEGGNDRGVVGVIPQGPRRSNVCLRVAKVVPDGEGSALISSLLQASEWCAEQAGDKPLVINLSFALNFQTAPEAPIYQRLYDQGVLIVAAAGNLGTSELMYPASHDSVISVAAVDAGSRRTDFSQYNAKVELSAPGDGIHVLVAQSNDVQISSGTSLASPFVAGLAARVWAAAPRCTNEDVRQILRDTARRLGSGVPNREYGYGLIRARDARDALVKAECSKAVPSQQPTVSPTTLPSAEPTLKPSQNPTTSMVPSQIPTVTCLNHLESCLNDGECCEGFLCGRLTQSFDDSLVCRRDVAMNSRPRLASKDQNICRGGFGGGCKTS